MISKNKIKDVRALHLKKFRIEQQLFIAEGEKIVHDLIYSDYKIHSIYVLDEWLIEFKNQYHDKIDFELNVVTEKELKQITTLTTPNKILAVAETPEHGFDFNNHTDALTLIIDDIQDPGNLGTIIRIADWFGIAALICSENTVEVYNPKVIQAAMGSLFRVKVFNKNLNDFFQHNKENFHLPVYGTTLDGKDIHKEKLQPKGLILFGNESKGISPELLKWITHPITIPSYQNKNNSIDSLNVSVAAGIICAEFRKG